MSKLIVLEWKRVSSPGALKVLLVAANLAVLVSCAKLPCIFTAKRVDWSFIQSVGGMSVGDLTPMSEGLYVLPVKVDVSGAHAITREPEIVDTGLAIKEIKWKQRENEIRIHVVTCAAKHDHDSPAFDDLILGLPRGDYTALYVNPDGSTVELGRLSANYPPASWGHKDAARLPGRPDRVRDPACSRPG